MKIPTPAAIAAAFDAMGYPMPLGVHVVLLRNARGKVDAFDDMLLVMRGGDELLHACRCTTDPGKGPRQNPKNPKGCAVWAPGQVVDGLGFGKHHGDYECLVPVKPILVDRYDSLTDATPTRSTSSTTQIHRASAVRESTVVGAWSEGCTVVANPAEFDLPSAPTSAGTLMGLCRASGQKRFTPTLLEWRG